MAKSSWFFLIVVSKWLTNHKNKLKSFKKTTRLIGLAFIRKMVKLESSQKLESSVCFFQELCLKHPNETVVCLSCSITSFLHLPNVLLKREKDTTKVKGFIAAEKLWFVLVAAVVFVLNLPLVSTIMRRFVARLCLRSGKCSSNTYNAFVCISESFSLFLIAKFVSIKCC